MNRFFGNKQTKKASALMPQHALLDDDDDDVILHGGDDSSDAAFPSYRSPSTSLQFSARDLEKPSLASPSPPSTNKMEQSRNVRRHKSSDGAEIGTTVMASPPSSPNRASRRFSSPERRKGASNHLSKAFLPILKGRRLGGKGSAKPDVIPDDPPSSDLFSQLTFSEPFGAQHMLSPENGARTKLVTPASESFTSTEWDPTTDVHSSFGLTPLLVDDAPSPSRRPKLKFTISSEPLSRPSSSKPSLVPDPTSAALPKSTVSKEDFFSMDREGEETPFVWSQNETSNVDWMAAEVGSKPLHVDVKMSIETSPAVEDSPDGVSKEPSPQPTKIESTKRSEHSPKEQKLKKSKRESRTPTRTHAVEENTDASQLQMEEDTAPIVVSEPKDTKHKARKESKTPIRTRSIEVTNDAMAARSEKIEGGIKTKVSKKTDKEPKTPTRSKDAADRDPKTPSRTKDASTDNGEVVKIKKSKEKDKEPKTPSKKETKDLANSEKPKTPKAKESTKDISTPKKKEKRSKTPLPSDIRSPDIDCAEKISVDKPPKSPSKTRSFDKDLVPKSPRRSASSDPLDVSTPEGSIVPTRAESQSRRRHSENGLMAKDKSVRKISSQSAHRQRSPSKSKDPPKTPKDEARHTQRSGSFKVAKVPKESTVGPIPTEITAPTRSSGKSSSPKKRLSAVNVPVGNLDDLALPGDASPKSNSKKTLHKKNSPLRENASQCNEIGIEKPSQLLLSSLEATDLKVPEIFSIDEDVPEWVNKAYTMIENYRADSALSEEITSSAERSLIPPETLSNGSCSSFSSTSIADKMTTIPSNDNCRSEEHADDHAFGDDGDDDDEISISSTKELEVENGIHKEPENVWITLKVDTEEPTNATIPADATGNAETSNIAPIEDPTTQPEAKSSFPVLSISKRDTAPSRSISNDFFERSFAQRDVTPKRSKSHDLPQCVGDPTPLENAPSAAVVEKQTIVSESKVSSATLPKLSYPSLTLSKRDTTPTRRSFSNDLQNHLPPLHQNKKDNEADGVKKEDVVLTGNKERFRELRRLAKQVANEPVSSEDEAEPNHAEPRRVGSKKPDRSSVDMTGDVEPIADTPKRRRNQNSSTFRNLRRLAKRAANEPLSDDDETVHNGTAVMSSDAPPIAQPESAPVVKESTTKRTTRLSRQRSAPIVERSESKNMNGQQLFLQKR